MVERIDLILRELEEAREGLLSYADEVWVDIDHSNATKLASGNVFIESLHKRITDLSKVTSELEELVRQYAHSDLRKQPHIVQIDKTYDARQFAELDRATTHTLSESFTKQRPYGFILQKQAVTGIVNWRDLYRALIHLLSEHDPVRFNALPENDEFLSPQGHRQFTRSQEELREAMPVGESIFAEANCSANYIRDNMKRLLKVFGYHSSDLRIYLRQDFDAGSDKVS